ncbi:olfactory receptor 6B1-like [Spea bombifrons]|uniref:olfactory receptor 6B1-like n=1 Tax=Spea bombifrons TaxID=233779 RepID=UPI00234A9802|nr:olfactory receptor 6B1-like [Spea bombifrons]
MKQKNQTSITEFILLGFSVSSETGFFLFALISIVYVVTITFNIFIIVLVISERRLHKPMYIFISGLSFLELWYPSVTVPKLLSSLLNGDRSISPGACVSQFYFHFACGATENFLLAVMAYDRYVAICHPLQYVVIISPQISVKLLVGCWAIGFILFLAPCFQISNLLFCSHNEIDHYYCDFAPIVRLSCSDISRAKSVFSGVTGFFILGCFLPIIVSYICIIRTIMAFPTSSGRRKAFSTCASHLIVVLIFYSTIMFMFIRPNTGDNTHFEKIISVFPSIVTSFLNPIIYTLRNQEVKVTVIKLFRDYGFRN